jgi:hypothetical protein
MNDAMRRSYQLAAPAIALLTGASQAVHATTIQPGHDFPVVVVSCTLPDDADRREWRAEQRDAAGSLVLTLRTNGSTTSSATLPLPAPELLRADGRLLLSAASANGGASVTIQVSPSGALLDVFVNHELEVNVHRDLSPEVERMNTQGPRRDARCSVPPGVAE